MGGAVTALLVIRVARIALVATYALSGGRQRLPQHRAGDIAARERQGAGGVAGHPLHRSARQVARARGLGSVRTGPADIDASVEAGSLSLFR